MGTHHLDHAVLLLSQISYSRIPVVTAERKFVGTISLTDILSYQLKHEIPEETFASMDIVDVAKNEVGVIGLDFNLTEFLHKLVDDSFLSVVDEEGYFQGIITRKSILKAINSLMHNFSNEYEMIPKWKNLLQVLLIKKN